MSDFKYDVFISHSSKDKPAVRELAERLVGDKVIVWLDEWEIQVGDVIPLKIRDAIDESKHIVYVMSPNAKESGWANLEHLAALFDDPTNKEKGLLPLLLADTDIPKLLKQISYVDWRNQDDHEYQKLLAACRGKKAPRRTSAASPSPATDSDPVRNEAHTEILSTPATATDDFMGREDELKEIRARLLGKKSLTLVNGEGGIGKTSLAAKYWERYHMKYKTAAWLYCENGAVQAIRNELAAPMKLTDELNQYKGDADQEYKAISRTLANMPHDCLLVLDNVNKAQDIMDFQKYFGGIGWHVLATSRCHGVTANEYPIESLPPALARELFIKHHPQAADYATELDLFLKAINYNTLCLEIYAKYLRETYPTYNLATLVKKLQEKGLFIDNNISLPADYTQNPMETIDGFIGALYEINDLPEDEVGLLTSLALLPAENHELRFLSTLLQDKPEDLMPKLKKLWQKGWIFNRADHYRLSPVVQAIVLRKNEEELWTYARKLIEVINVVIHHENGILQDSYLAPPFVASGMNIMKNIKVKKDELSILCYNLVCFFTSIGNLNMALGFANEMHEISIATGNSFHISNAFQMVGNVYEAQGDIVKALNYFEQYSEINKEICLKNPDNIDSKDSLAVSYFKIGGIYLKLGNKVKAFDYYNLHLKLFDELYKANPENKRFKNGLSVAYTFLGNYYFEERNYDRAYEYYLDLISLSTELHKDDPDNLEYILNLGTANSKIGKYHFSKGNFQLAIEFHNKAKAHFEELCKSSPFHVSFKKALSASYQFLGETHTAAGNYHDAIHCFIESEKNMFLAVKSSPSNIEFKQGLASCYQYLGYIHNKLENRDLALLNYEKFVKFQEEVHNIDPENLDSKHRLALSYQLLGNLHFSLKNLNESHRFTLLFYNIEKELTLKFPVNLDFQHALAMACINMGNVLFANKDARKSVDYYGESKLVLKWLRQTYPENVEFLYFLAISSVKLGYSYDQIEDRVHAKMYYKEAETLFIELIAIAPENESYRQYRGLMQRTLTDMD